VGNSVVAEKSFAFAVQIIKNLYSQRITAVSTAIFPQVCVKFFLEYTKYSSKICVGDAPDEPQARRRRAPCKAFPQGKPKGRSRAVESYCCPAKKSLAAPAIPAMNTGSKLYKYLREEKKEFVLSKQLLRSGTSIGANIQEALQGQSKRDFLMKMNIAL
jgi:hypothetical protein